MTTKRHVSTKAKAVGLRLRTDQADCYTLSEIVLIEEDDDQEEGENESDADGLRFEVNETGIVDTGVETIEVTTADDVPPPPPPEEIVFRSTSLDLVEAFIENYAATSAIVDKRRRKVRPPSEDEHRKAIAEHAHAGEIAAMIGPAKGGRPKKVTRSDAPPPKAAGEAFNWYAPGEAFAPSPERLDPQTPLDYDPAPKATLVPIVTKARKRVVDVDVARIATLYRMDRRPDAGRVLQQKRDALGHGGWRKWLAGNEAALGFGWRTAQRLIEDAETLSNVSKKLA